MCIRDSVKLVRKSNNLSVFTQKVKFQYGYDEADSDYINGLDEGDTVEISNDNPVITGTMFDKIAKINNYKNVTLAGNDWEFTVNVTDETTKNMVHNNAGIKAVLAAYPDQDFNCLLYTSALPSMPGSLHAPWCSARTVFVVCAALHAPITAGWSKILQV